MRDCYSLSLFVHPAPAEAIERSTAIAFAHGIPVVGCRSRAAAVSGPNVRRRSQALANRHGQLTGTVALSTLGLTTGNNYGLAVFRAERHTTQSNFRIDTTLAFSNCGQVNGVLMAPHRAHMTRASGGLTALGGGR